MLLLLLLLHLLRAALLSLCFFSSVFSVGQTKISSAAWPITRVNSVGAAGGEAGLGRQPSCSRASFRIQSINEALRFLRGGSKTLPSGLEMGEKAEGMFD